MTESSGWASHLEDDERGSSNETKRERFVRLAEKRTNAVLYRLRVLGHCSNPYVYEYGPEDVAKIFGAIEQELRLTRAKFEMTRPEFRLGPGSGDGGGGE